MGEQTIYILFDDLITYLPIVNCSVNKRCTCESIFEVNVRNKYCDEEIQRVARNVIIAKKGGIPSAESVSTTASTTVSVFEPIENSTSYDVMAAGFPIDKKSLIMIIPGAFLCLLFGFAIGWLCNSNRKVKEKIRSRTASGRPKSESESKSDEPELTAGEQCPVQQSGTTNGSLSRKRQPSVKDYHDQCLMGNVENATLVRIDTLDRMKKRNNLVPDEETRQFLAPQEPDYRTMPAGGLGLHYSQSSTLPYNSLQRKKHLSDGHYRCNPVVTPTVPKRFSD